MTVRIGKVRESLTSGTVIISGPLNFVTIQQLVDLLHENNEIEIIDLSNTNHIDYIAMQTLKDLLSNKKPTPEEAGDDADDNDDVNDDDTGESRDQKPPKVILPIDCPDSFKTFLADANILILDHDIE